MTAGHRWALQAAQTVVRQLGVEGPMCMLLPWSVRCLQAASCEIRLPAACRHDEADSSQCVHSLLRQWLLAVSARNTSLTAAPHICLLRWAQHGRAGMLHAAKQHLMHQQCDLVQMTLSQSIIAACPRLADNMHACLGVITSPSHKRAQARISKAASTAARSSAAAPLASGLPKTAVTIAMPAALACKHAASS